MGERGEYMFFRVQTNIVMILILSIIFVHALFTFDQSEFKNRLFIQLMGLDIVIMLLEIGNVMVDGKGSLRLVRLHLFFNIIGIVMVPVFLLVGTLYFQCYLQKTLRMVKQWEMSSYIPAIILFGLAILNIKTGWIVSVDSYNHRIRGMLFWIIPATLLFYLAYGLLIIWRYHKKLSAYKYMMNIVYMIVVAISVILQVKYKDCLITWNVIGGLLVCAYIFNIIDELQYDALTTMENKQSYLRYVSRLIKRGDLVLTAVNIDLDDFKDINDYYGHQEGDEALKKFSQLLRGSFPYKCRIFRMGGDEFLVLSEYQNKRQIFRYIKRFKEKLIMYNQTREKPYELKFSYGMDSYSSDYVDVETFFNHIDSMMYAQKQRKKRRI